MQPKTTSQLMMEAPRCLLWRYGPPDAKGKRPKIPYYANGRQRHHKFVSPEDLAELVTGDVAKKILASGQGYDGIGFVSGPDETGNYWQFVDFDAVDANGLADLVNAAQGYLERSPSETGAHAIGYGPQIPTLASNNSGLEAYSNGQFCTFTGDAFRDDPPTDLAPFVAQAIASRHGAGKAGKAAPAAPPARQQAGPLDPATPDPATMAQLADALTVLDPRPYGVWQPTLSALKSIPNNGGFEMAREWSRRSNYCGDDEFKRKWHHDIRADHTNWRAVFTMAQANGWQNPGWRQDVAPVQHGLAAFDPRSGQGVSPSFLETLNLIDLLRIVERTPARLFTTTFFTPCGEVTLLSADGGVGKTNFALAWGLCLAFGIAGLSLHIPAPVTVLFATGEDPAIECGRRLKEVAATLNLNIQGDWFSEGYGRFHLWDTEGAPLWVESRDNPAGVPTPTITELERRIVATGAKQVFIDNASTVFLADHNALAPVNGFIGALRRIAARTGCNIVLLAHVNAETATKGGGKTYNGSVAWNNSVRSRMFMKAVPAEADLPEHIIVSHEKANLGPKAPSFKLRRNPDTGVLSAFTNHEIAAAIDESFAPLVEKVFSHIQEAQSRGEQIRSAASGSKTAYHGLSDMFPQVYPETDAKMKRRVKLAIAKLSDEGRIVKRSKYDNTRNPYQVWAVLSPDDPLYGRGI